MCLKKATTSNPLKNRLASCFLNKHLPSLPKAGEDYTGAIDIAKYQMGMLEELHKAHIYISQPNETVKEPEAEIDSLKECM